MLFGGGTETRGGTDPGEGTVALGACQPRVPALPLALGTLDVRALEESGGQCAQFGL